MRCLVLIAATRDHYFGRYVCLNNSKKCLFFLEKFIILYTWPVLKGLTNIFQNLLSASSSLKWPLMHKMQPFNTRCEKKMFVPS